MPGLGSIYDAKEFSQTFSPLTLIEVQTIQGSIYRASTAPLGGVWSNQQFKGQDWDPRLLNADLGSIQAMSDLGVDIVPQITINLADPDKTLFFAWENAIGFKGAILRVYTVMHDASGATFGTGSFTDDLPTPIKFIGTCGPSSSDQGVLTFTATSLLNFTQKQMPPQRIQQICSWSFAPDQPSRSAALTDPFSIFYQCGYSFGEPGGVGNPDPSSPGGTGAFQSCALSRAQCTERLGDGGAAVPIMQDTFGNPTGRFGGYEWVPPQNGGRQRNYLSGRWDDITNATNDAKYGDFMRLCYGTTWVKPLVMGVWGDGNYTNLEVAICFGELNAIHKVVVNGIEVQQLGADTDPGYRPSLNRFPSDANTSTTKNGWWKTINNGGRNGVPSAQPGWAKKGDPYGSISAIYVSVLKQVAAENSVPSVQILVDGIKVPVYTDVNTSNVVLNHNPAWMLKDLLVKAGWRDKNIDLQSFIDVAAYNNQVVNFDSMNGNYQNFYNESGNPPFKRFECGFAVEQRTPFGDLVRGLRTNMRAMLYFNFNTGKLTLMTKQTLGDQQPAPILGSNNIVAFTSVSHDGTPNTGYSAYSFDGSSIVKDSSGRSSLSVVQKSLQETPNKTSLQFLNRENSYGQDSVTVIDVEDVRRVGQEIAVSIPVIGIQTFDQARRILNNWLAENYRGNPRLDYLGSAIGDTGGTLVFQFTTSVKALHLTVGQIIDITDAQFGFDQQLLRVVRIKPSTNYETVQITALFHNDNWYQDTFGTNEQPIYGPAQGLGTVPYAWRPGYAAPIANDPTRAPSDLTFDAFPQYTLAADGTGLAAIQITGKIPVNSFSSFLHKPKLEVIGQGTTGGGYPTGSYYVAVAEKGPNTTVPGGSITGARTPGPAGRLIPISYRSSPAIGNPGSGYNIIDRGRILGGTGGTYLITTVGAGGAVTGFTILNQGTGYTPGATVGTANSGPVAQDLGVTIDLSNGVNTGVAFNKVWTYDPYGPWHQYTYDISNGEYTFYPPDAGTIVKINSTGDVFVIPVGGGTFTPFPVKFLPAPTGHGFTIVLPSNPPVGTPGAPGITGPQIYGTLGATSPSAIVAVDPGEDAVEVVAQAWPGSPQGFVAFAGLHAGAMSYQAESTATPLVVDLINNYNVASWGPPDDTFSHHEFRARLVYVSGPFGNILPYTFTPPLVTPTSIKLTTYQNYGLVPNQLAGRTVSVLGLAPRLGKTDTPIPVANFIISGNSADELFIGLGNGDPSTAVGGAPLTSGDVVAVRFQPTFGQDSVGNYFEDLLLDDYALSNLNDLRTIGDASNTTPIKITLSLAQNEVFPFVDGDFAVIQGVTGNTAANGRFQVTGVGAGGVPAQFTIAGSSGNGAYTGGGIVGTQPGIANTQVGNLAFILSGPGEGTYAKIVSNTKSRFYIDGDWPTQPGGSSIIIIVSDSYVVVQPGAPINNSFREFVSTQSFDIQNYDRVAMLIEVSTISKAGKSSLTTLNPFREIFLVGNPFTRPAGVPGGPLFNIRTEEYATVTINDFEVPVNPAAVNEANFLLPSADESDVGWYGLGIASTSAAYSVNLRSGRFNSRFGRTFKVGDYVLWNDPNGYECDFVSAIDNVGNTTLIRQDPAAGPGTAFFGSPATSHPFVKIYRLEPKVFTGILEQNMYGTSATPSGLPEQWTWAWPNRCVVSAVGQTVGLLGNSPVATKNLGTVLLVQNNNPPCPGLRTLSGAAYTNLSAGAALAAGTVADQRIQVQSWSSIRCVSATVLSVPTTGNAVIHVVWISPDLAVVGLIDTLIIPQGSFTNYAPNDLPRDRQMPYHANGWPLEDWPPNELPLCIGSPIVAGVLALPITPNDAGNQNPIFAPDGFIDFIVEAGGGAGNLTVNVQV